MRRQFPTRHGISVSARGHDLLHFGCRKAQDDELGDRAYTKRFEVALSQPRPEGLVAAYAVLWAAYEDALKGDLNPVVKERRPS